jgi:GxxExxY protein
VAQYSEIESLITIAIDCGFQIHTDIGPGMLESAYEMLMAAALNERGLRVERQKPVELSYRGLNMPDAYRIDLLVEDQLIIELKSLEQLTGLHSKQLLTYLRLTQLPIGLLMNFGSALFKDGIKRVINNRSDYLAPKIRRSN